MIGAGIIKSMVETARNFVGSYHDESRMVTVQYPEERIAPKENARSFPFLVYDGNDPMAGLRCVSCTICEKECPPKCIYIVQLRDEKGKLVKHPRIFDIDVSVCMSCQICVEVCPFEAIKMDQEVELSAFGRFEDLLVHKDRLAKSNEYFHKLHPTDAAAIDAELADAKAKAEAKAAAAAAAKPAPAKPAAAPPAPPA